MKTTGKSLFAMLAAGVGLIGGGTFLLTPPAWSAKKSPPDQKLVEWVEKQTRKLQPTQFERRIDEIGWANGIRHAIQLAKQHRRPVFMFTHDGRVNTGRC